MTINLMQNKSENNKINKNLVNLSALSGTLKDSTSIIDPVIIVVGLTSSMLSECNYAEIPEFSRYYFVKDIKSVRNNVWEITMHVDVLKSFSNQILKQKAVIKRQENNWNLYLDDGIFKTYQNPNIITKAFPAGFTNQNFILTVAGG